MVDVYNMMHQSKRGAKMRMFSEGINKQFTSPFISSELYNCYFW